MIDTRSTSKLKKTWIRFLQNLKLLWIKGHEQEGKKGTHSIFANNIFDKGLVPRIYISKSHNSATESQILKWATNLFFQRHKCPTSLAIMEMQHSPSFSVLCYSLQSPYHPSLYFKKGAFTRYLFLWEMRAQSTLPVSAAGLRYVFQVFYSVGNCSFEGSNLCLDH